MAEYKLYQDDFRNAPKIEKLHSLVIDPPYCAGGIQEAQKTKPEGTVGECAGKEALLNDSLSTEGYKRMMRKAFGNPYTQEVYCFFDWKMYVPTFECLEDAGVCIRGVLVWDKCSPGLGAGWRTQHELIFWGIRPGIKMKSWGKHSNILSFKRASYQKRQHPTEKPIELMKTIVEQTKFDLIVDLFCGSGSTGVAALQAGKSFIGCEMYQKYFEVAERRLAAVG